MDANGDPRVVLVHDWLTGMRGGEKCLEVLCRRWPHAPLFTLLHRARLRVAGHRGACSRGPASCNSCPASTRYYRYLLPLMPAGRRELASAAAATWSSASAIASPRRCVRRAACRTSATASRRCATPGTCARRTSARPGARRSRRGRWSACSAGCATGTGAPPTRVTPFHRHQPDRAAAHRRVLRPRQHRHLSAGRHRLLPPRAAARARITTWPCRPSPPTSGSTWRCERASGSADRWSSSAPARTRRRLRGAGRADGALPRLAARRGHPRSSAPLPGAAVPRRGGLRHRAGRGDGLRHAGDRLRPRRRRARRSCRSAAGASRPALWFEEQTADCLADAMLALEKTGDLALTAARQQAQRFNGRRFAEEMFAYLDGVLRPAEAPARPLAA